MCKIPHKSVYRLEPNMHIGPVKLKFPRKITIIIPPTNFVCGGVYFFYVVRACVRPSVRP